MKRLLGCWFTNAWLLALACSSTVVEEPPVEVEKPVECSFVCKGDQGKCHAWQTQYTQVCGDQETVYCCWISPVDPVCPENPDCDLYVE